MSKQTSSTNKNPTILIVDDEDVSRILLAQLLTLYDYNVVEVSNAMDAFQLARNQSIDVAILDVMMPEMDGFELSAMLKNHPVTAQIPVIILTALIDEASREKAYEVGAEVFLSKPVGIDELRSHIEKFTQPLEIVEINSLHIA